VPSDSSTYAIIPRPVVLTPKRGAFTLSAAATKRARHTWRGMVGGFAAAKANHDVVMAPGSHTYFDHYQSRDKPKAPLAIGGFTPIDSVYAFEPVPPHLSANEAKHVLGAQAQLWAEYMPNAKHVEYGLPTNGSPVGSALEREGASRFCRLHGATAYTPYEIGRA